MSASVSVVLLTYNRRTEVLATLRCLRRAIGATPLIVVDNASSDGTDAAVRQADPHCVLVRAPRNLGAAGRNLGMCWVRTPYVAFSDDDTCWEAGALQRAVAILDAHPEVAVLNARILVGGAAALDPTCARMAASPLPLIPGAGPQLTGFMAGACVMCAQAFRQAGGYWAPLFIGGEERLLALDLLQAGWRIVYAPQVVTRHHPSPLRDSALRRRLLARNAIWTAWLRLPVGAALRETWRVLRAAAGRERWAVAGAALGGWRLLAAGRRPVGARVRRLLATQATQQEDGPCR
ncbi:glycosyl transferase family 2 [Bordetella bronchiseptica]|nr:glycosyl transferase family 2 [Bordetella bronchiseptica]